MKQRIHILTLGVADLKKSMNFYRDGFGWQTKGIVGTEFENGAIVLFELDNGMRVIQDIDDHLWEIGYNPSWQVE